MGSDMRVLLCVVSYSTVPAFEGAQGSLVAGGQFFEAVDGDAEVVHQAILEAVDPAVNGQLLAASPGILDDRRVAQADHLFQHVQLAQAIVALFFRQAVDQGAVFGMHLLDVMQPEIDDADPLRRRAEGVGRLIETSTLEKSA